MPDENGIQVSRNLDIHWWFEIRSDVDSCAGAMEETKHLCEKLFDAFEDFITPITVDYYILCYEEATRNPYRSDSDDYSEQIDRTISNGNGLDFSDFVNSIPNNLTGDCRISGIKFTQANVQVVLQDGVYSLGEHKHSSNREFQPHTDPLRINLLHLPNKDISGQYPNGHYRISISARTNIWFEESDIGQKNRDILGSFFDRLVNGLPVTRILYEVPGQSRQEVKFD